jgi:hypothetical protein
MNSSECYQILEIEPTQSLSEIKEAYRDIVFVWHPDRLEARPRVRRKAEEKLKKINSAYEILKSQLANLIPRLSEIEIYPENVEIEAGESQSFWVVGYDQNGNEVELEDVRWSVSGGGFIYGEGTFFAEYESGEYTVSVVCDGITATTSFYVLLPEVDSVEEIADQTEEAEEDVPVRESSISSDQEEEFIPSPDNGFPWKRLIFWPLVVWSFSMNETGAASSLIDRIGPLLELALVLGWIRPQSVFKFGLANTRSSVTQVYFSLILLLNATTSSDIESIGLFWRMEYSLLSLWLLGMVNPRWTINFGENSRSEITNLYIGFGLLIGITWGCFRGLLWAWHGVMA